MNKSINKAVEEAKQLAAEHPDELVSLYKLDNHSIYASPSHENLTGYKPSDVVGNHWSKFVVQGDHAHADLAGNDALLNGKSVEFGVRLRTKGGEIISIRGSVRMISDAQLDENYLLFQAELAPA